MMFQIEQKVFMTMKTTFFKVSKMAFFHRGYPMLLAKKCIFFHYLFSLKIRLERRFNNILGRKKTYFDYERKILYGLKSRLFLKGLTHAFGQIMPIFICFRSKQDYKQYLLTLQIKKRPFFTITAECFKVLKITFFQRG